ncbi:MAG: N-6 DNA methylase [Cyanobacteria bacterium J06576_12]
MAFIHRAVMHPSKVKQQFGAQLKSLSASQSPHRVFSDWLEIAAITLHQLPYHSGELAKDSAFETLEAQYMERIKAHDRENLFSFSEMLSLLIMAHNGSYGDFLGDIAGEYELLNKHVGQFFTPYHLCRLLAKMSIGDVRSLVEEKGIITVCEPAVGAGGLVIATAEEAASQGVDPRAYIQFDCTDVSRDAFNMAYIQLSALGLQAVVRHGNTLSGEYWEHRPTPQLRMFEQWLAPRRKEQRLIQAMRSVLAGTCPAEPEAWDSPPVYETTSGQTLFDLEQFAREPLTKKRLPKKPDVVLDRQMDLFG